MASIDRRPNGKWRARWREYPGGPQKARHFARKLDAERFLVDVQHKMLTGAYVGGDGDERPCSRSTHARVPPAGQHPQG
jgi:hypothetical protein